MKNIHALRHFSIIFIFLLLGSALSAQVSGRLLDALTGDPIEGAQLLDEERQVVATTDTDGTFSYIIECTGNYQLIIRVDGADDQRQLQCSQKDLGTLYFRRDLDLDDQIFTTNLDNDGGDGVDQENISSLLTATNDIFGATAAFTFGPARFRRRGYGSQFSEMFLNGMPANKLDNSAIIWSQWGGLNDVTRLRSTQNGLLVSDMSLGGLGGTIGVDLRASSQRKQTRLTMSATNRSYRWRQMLTYSTGLMESGWAVSLSASHRWAEEGYIPGTSYESFSYFLSVDKKLGTDHLLNLVVLGAPSRRGRQGPAQQELFDIAGTNYYNPFWGYQNGEKRNSRIGKFHQPIAMLRYDYNPSPDLEWTTTVSYQTGRSGSTALDWFDAQDPRPDYYRNLPSFYDDEATAAGVREKLENDENARQINWDRLYATNLANMDAFADADGIEGNTVTGFRSQYIVSERRFDSDEANINSIARYSISDDLSLQGGIQYRYHKGDIFNLVDDLLGGDFYVDLDRFALTDFPDNPDAAQNDLNRPNRVVREGDRYGHDYEMHIRKSRAWLQAQYTTRSIDFYAGASYTQEQFWRDGKVVKGLFPDRSFGESERYDFGNVGLKAGAVLKLDGRNYIHFGGYHAGVAPTSRDAFLSPRTRNDVVPELVSETQRGLELSYNLRAPKVKVLLAAYHTEVLDQIETRSFFHDDLRTFVNFSLSGIDTKHQGIELGVEYDIAPGWNIHGVAAVGQYTINSRPQAVFTQDNNATEQLKEFDRTVYAQDVKLGGTPQSAYNIGLTYRSANFWSLFVNFNYFDRVYTSYNPIRRTVFAVEGVDPGSQQYEDILRQEDLPGRFTMDASWFKSWKVNWLGEKSSFVSLSVGLTNVLDNQDLITGGFEQLRFDFTDQDINAFPSRYFHFQGFNYFINANYRF